jgi:pimeloyl-ACP methyl ester carboxylesterase
LSNGIRTHSLIAGRSAAEPIGSRHGYPANCFLWQDCIAELAPYFPIRAPDLPGHGKTDKPLDCDYDLGFFVRFLSDYFDSMGLAKATLITHDLGGMAGLGFVARHPEKSPNSS